MLVGLDIGASHTKALLLDAQGQLASESSWESIPPEGDPLAHCIAQLHVWLPSSPQAIGLAICGLIHRNGHTLLHAPNARALEGLPWHAGLADAFQCPVALLNDATAFVYAEHRRGAAVDKRDVLGLTLGTGIGGGLILNGELAAGATGWAGELGLTRLDFDGPAHVSGQAGCLEAYIGAHALVAEYNARAPLPALSPSDLVTRAQQGEGAALQSWTRYGEYLGIAIGRALMLLDADCIVLGGGLAVAYPWFEEALYAALEREVIHFLDRRVAVRVALLGSHAGALGAALWAQTHGEGPSAPTPPEAPLPDGWEYITS